MAGLEVGRETALDIRRDRGDWKAPSSTSRTMEEEIAPPTASSTIILTIGEAEDEGNAKLTLCPEAVAEGGGGSIGITLTMAPLFTITQAAPWEKQETPHLK